MSQHTPTPWEVVDAFGPNPDGICFGEVANRDRMIASGTGYYGRDTARANVAFIVRACNAHDDLVAALHVALAILSSPLTTTEGDIGDALEIGEAIKQVRTALAKVDEA